MGGGVSGARPLLTEGEIARLIPVGPESAKERRAVSPLLAVIMAVAEFRREVLSAVDGPSGPRAWATCYTEVVFKGASLTNKLRPDGLIVVESGNRTWQALVEAKIGNNILQKDQIEGYLDLAKEQRIDAVITISNQFVARPVFQPVAVSGHKTRSVGLFHLSWYYLLTKAQVLKENAEVADPDQAFILSELLRFFRAGSSGVLVFRRMPAEWKQVCNTARLGDRFSASDPSLETVARRWDELGRYISLLLSGAVGRDVAVWLPRKHQSDPDARVRELVDGIVKGADLSMEFVVPDAAGRIRLAADFRARTLSASMRVDAPQDKKFSKACVTWLRRQLDGCTDQSIEVRAFYPRQRVPTKASLAAIREDSSVLSTESSTNLPRSFEVRRVADNANRFLGPQTFVEEATQLVRMFYADVGQHLESWRPQAPRVIAPKSEPTDLADARPGPAPTEQDGPAASDAGPSREQRPQAFSLHPFGRRFVE